MNVSEVLKNLAGTSAAVEIMNEIVLGVLTSSRETLILERERLDEIAKTRPLSDFEQEDWEMIVQDIVAIDRVIDYYGGS